MAELTEEQIKKAQKQKHCPFCGGQDFFATYELAGRNFWFKDDKIGWGERDTDGIQTAECNTCGEEIPKEIWEKWNLEK